MEASSSIRAAAKHAGVTLYELSRRLDRAPAWAGITSSPGRDPKASTIAAIADVCGCEVVIVDRQTGERVATIDPPGRD